jgi:heme oxygenase
MAWLKLDVTAVDNYEKLLQKDPKLIASDIIDFIIYLKDHKKLAPASVGSDIAALRHFYDFNDIDLRWKKINSFKGEYYNVTEDRPYTREEIKLLADRAELRFLYRLNMWVPRPVFIINLSDLPLELKLQLNDLKKNTNKWMLKRVVKSAIGRILESVNERYYHLSGAMGKIEWRFEQ